MKKINLKNLSIDEVLSKDQLKKIVGGNGSGTPDWGYFLYCYCSNWPVGGWKIFGIYSQADLDEVPNEMSYQCDIYDCEYNARF